MVTELNALLFLELLVTPKISVVVSAIRAPKLVRPERRLSRMCARLQ